MRVTIILFPGSNCDHDVIHAYKAVLQSEVSVVWHRDTDLHRPDLVVLPGGFAYGDYLRTGALAKLSPVMMEVSKFAKCGGLVIGICNGFQILCEAGLLPGVLLQNVQRRFLSQFVNLRVERAGTPLTKALALGSVVTCPIAHFEGNFFAPPEMLERIEGDGHVVFRYCDEAGKVAAADLSINPNGSLNSIAGICSADGHVVGLMPHPERAIEQRVGSIGRATGLPFLASSFV